MASKAASLLRILLGLVVLAVGVATLIGAIGIRRIIPPLDGATPVSGLHAVVRVDFDAFAIPHISAESDEDAWAAVGYLQGRDRLWQLELYRRAASGRLAEIFGEDLVAVDQRFLTLGLRRGAEAEFDRAAPDARLALAAYARGVNAAMSAAGRWKRPVELQLLGIQREPWTPVDSLAIGKLFAWRLGENHHAELLRFELAAQLGARAAELLGPPPSWAPVILNGFTAPVARQIVPGGGFPPGLAWLSDEHHGASNSWVVSGARTASGRPLLANDPHLSLELPSTWWEAHVTSSSGLNVSGATIPGTPFVVIGHNARIAWGLTNSGADVQDFFLEQLDASREHYRSAGEWLPLAVTHHEIRVKGRSAPFAFDVRSTPHGPVLNAADWEDPLPRTEPASAALNEHVLALKWDAVLAGASASGFDALARAQTWPAFTNAVRQITAPSQNFVYADVDGNIGYALGGLLPMRRSGDGSSPTDGSIPSSDWAGSVPLEELPAWPNPESGQIVTANNEVDRRPGHTLTRDWVAPFRARRIEALLGKRAGLDIPAFEAMQADITSLSADALLTALGPTAPEELRNWDRRVDGRSVSALYEAFEAALWQRTFADEMPEMLYDRFYRYAANERLAGLLAIVGDRQSPWFDDRGTPSVVETRDDMVRLAENDARATLTARFGTTWAWDQIHAAKFSHALAGGGWVLDWFFSRGPVPLGGDGMTVNKTTTNLRRPFETSEGASYRQVLDVGDWDASVAVNTTGQSGYTGSAHYFDQNALWAQGRYHAVPFSRPAVEAASVSRLNLTPGP